MKNQDWHNNIVKQLSSPTRLKSDALVCSSKVASQKGALNVGRGIAATCDIAKIASQIIAGDTNDGFGTDGFYECLGMLTCGASPDLYNQIYAKCSQTDRQGMAVASALRLGMILVTAPANLTDKAQTAYYMTYGMQGAPEKIKAGLMRCIIKDSDGKNGAKIAISEIAKARGYRSAFGIDLNPFDLVSSVVGDVGDIISSIPGVGPVVGFFGSQAQDFANTTVGQIALTAFAGVTYGELAPAMGILGPQIASVTFAIPGLAKGDDFFHAWIIAFLDRLKQLAEYLGGQAAAEIAAQFQPAVDGLMKAAQDAGIDPEAFTQNLQLPSFASDQLNKMADGLGVRADMLQQALDYVSKETAEKLEATVQMDGVIPIPIPGQDGRTFDIATGKATGDTRDPLHASPVFAQKTTTPNLSALKLTKVKATPTLAQKTTAPNIAAASAIVKANVPPVTAPLPATKLHWWTRLYRWVHPANTQIGYDLSTSPRSFHADPAFNPYNPTTWNLPPKAPDPSFNPFNPTTWNIPPKAPATTRTFVAIKPKAVLQAIPQPHMAAATTPVATPDAPAPSTAMVPVTAVAKPHWWVRLWHWVARKPAAAG